jgi:subtilisin-like proprotein convertase family protein
VLAVLTVLGVFVSPSWPQADVWEVNDLPPLARLLLPPPALPQYDPFAVARIRPDTDHDWFVLQPEHIGGNWVSAWVKPLAGPSPEPDTLLQFYTTFPFNLVEVNDDIDPAIPQSGIAGALFPQDATTLIQVQLGGGIIAKTATDFRYQLVTLTTPSTPTTNRTEIEPNNASPQSQALGPGDNVSGAVNSTGDEDWYSADLGDPSLFELNVALKNQTAAADFEVRIYAADGVTEYLGFRQEGGAGKNDFINIGPGSHPSPLKRIRVRSLTGTGGYQLFVGGGVLAPPPGPSPLRTCSLTSIPLVDASPSKVGVATSVLFVPAPIALEDLDVFVDVTHGGIGDLEIGLRHLETGGQVLLFSRACPLNPDLITTFDDEGLPLACPLDRGGHTRPTGFPAAGLSVFDGELLAGTWILSVTDHAVGVSGTLNEWCLEAREIPVTPTPTATDSATPTSTPTDSPTSTKTITRTPSSTSSSTATVTRTFTPSSTPTGTATPSDTPTSTGTATVTATPSPTDTPTSSPTETSTETATATSSPTVTPTATLGYPVITSPTQVIELPGDEIFSTLAVAELDGDAEVELVFGTDRTGSNDTGTGLHAINLNGTPAAGQWPVLFNSDVRSSPAAADLDLDGLDEIVVGTYGPSQTIRILNHDGSPRGVATSNFSVISSPAIGDLNGDHLLEIVVGTSDGTLLVLNGNGSSFSPAWPVTLPNRVPPMQPRNDVDSSPALGDLDGDGHPDIVVLSDEGILYAYNKDGQPLPGFPFVSPRDTYPAQVETSANSASPILADVDGDLHLDVVVAMTNGRVYGLRGDGTSLPGFPIHLPPGSDPGAPSMAGDNILSTPAVGDVDGDGLLELVVAFQSAGTDASRIYVYDLTGPADGRSMQWPTFHSGPLRRGFFFGEPSGDTVRDGVLDGKDLMNLLNTWQRYPTMPRYEGVLDFNQDQRIDGADIPPLLDRLNPKVD